MGAGKDVSIFVCAVRKKPGEHASVHLDFTSTEHQSSSCRFTTVSSQPAHTEATNAERYLTRRCGTYDILVFTVVLRNSSLPLHAFSVWLITYSCNFPSVPSTLKDSEVDICTVFCLHQRVTVMRWREVNLFPFPCDFSISGRNLPFGARHSGIWEGKVLIRPEAQQCVSFNQWVLICAVTQDQLLVSVS